MSSEIYRDRSEGAVAKRQDLLRKRRDELVTMPHAVRRVVVARRARIAGSLAVIVAGTAFVTLANAPSWVAKIADQVPGQPAVLAVALVTTWAVGVLAYLVARARAEHKFAVAMSQYVLPGEDVDHDLQRLDHEHPDAVARRMAHDLEARSAAAPILAISMLVPATAVYLFQVANLKGWPLVADVEGHFARHASTLGWLAAVGAVGAAASAWSVWRRPMMAVMLPVGVIAGAFAPYAAFHAAGWIAWSALAVACVGTVMGVNALRLRSERALLDATDPSAGADGLTIASIVAGAKAIVATVRGVAVQRRLQIGFAAMSVTGLVIAGSFHHKKKTHEASPQLASAPMPLDNNEAPVDLTPGYHVEDIGGGRLRIDAVIMDHLDVPALADLDALPAGWRAHVSIEQLDGPPVKVTPFVDTRNELQALQRNLPVSFDADACDGHTPGLGLYVALVDNHPSLGAQQISLVVTPQLSPAHCQLDTP